DTIVADGCSQTVKRTPNVFRPIRRGTDKHARIPLAPAARGALRRARLRRQVAVHHRRHRGAGLADRVLRPRRRGAAVPVVAEALGTPESKRGRLTRKLAWTALSASAAAGASLAAERLASGVWRRTTGEDPPAKK